MYAENNGVKIWYEIHGEGGDDIICVLPVEVLSLTTTYTAMGAHQAPGHPWRHAR